MIKIIFFLCFVYVSLQGVSTCYGSATSVLELQGCDGERICQTTCNNPDIKCNSSNPDIARGTFKELAGRKYFVPPYPLEIKVKGIDEAYDIACVTHSTAKATLLKILDNVRKQAHYNLTQIANGNPQYKEIVASSFDTYQRIIQKRVKIVAKGIKPEKDNKDAFDSISKKSVVSDIGPLGKLKGLNDPKVDKYVTFLQSLISLMNPNGEFVEFWANLREFCKIEVNGKIPNQRAIIAFYQYPFSQSTRKLLMTINTSTDLLNRLGISSQVVEDPITNAPGQYPASNHGSTLNLYYTYFKKTFADFAMGSVTVKAGVSVLDTGGPVPPAPVPPVGPGSVNQITDYSQLINGQSVADLIGYLADWATSSLNERCPCSDVQNVLIAGIAPDGTTHPDIPKLYNVDHVISTSQPDIGAQMILKRDQLCFAAYPGICKKRAPGDNLDISDDDLLGAITNGQMPKCSGELAFLPRCSSTKVLEQNVEQNALAEELGYFVELDD